MEKLGEVDDIFHDLWKYIGRNCMAVVVNPPNSETSFEAYYFPHKAMPQSYAPHVIFSGIAYKGIESGTGETPPWWKT